MSYIILFFASVGGDEESKSFFIIPLRIYENLEICEFVCELFV